MKQTYWIKALHKLTLFYYRNFKVLTTQEAEELKLTHCHNIYGDAINIFNCRSIWRDEKGRGYRVASLL